MQYWKVAAGENGLLCRQDKDLKSAELQRLANGSIVQELELVGDRLHFWLVNGEGPPSGWISVKVKGKEVAVRLEEGPTPTLPEEVTPCTAEDLDLGPSKPPEERPYGIIVYGASGFTGQLAVQHLDALFLKAGGPKVPWALAGRNAEKLNKVKKLCKTEVDTIVVTNDQEVHTMVSECRVVISAVGPHAKWGEPVIRACVAYGTHYADMAGETWWLKRMIAKYDAEARKRGVVLVIMCAQQAVVADIAVSKLVKKLGPLKQVRGYVLQMAFTTGGTDNNGRYGMEVVAKNPHIWKDMRDPFNMGGLRKCGVRDSDQDCSFAEKDTLFPKFWLGPLGCATGDLRCVRRSSELFEEARGGRELRYGDEVAMVWREPTVSKAAADRLVEQFGPMPSPEVAGPSLAGMMQGVLFGQSPPPGEGPPRESRERFYVSYTVVAESESGQWATCRFDGGDPYEVTSMCCAVGGLTLLEELESINVKECAGINTPAFTFDNSGFVESLQSFRWAGSPKGASLKWEVEEGQPTPEEMMEKWKGRSKSYAVLTPEMTQGLVKQWALPDYAAAK